MRQYEITYYQSANGKYPFLDWLHGLAVALQERVLARIDRVAEGNLGDHKSVGDGVYELRFTFGAGYRAYYGQDEGMIILLLNGGDKNSQVKDIKNAKQLWQEYLKHKSPV